MLRKSKQAEQESTGRGPIGGETPIYSTDHEELPQMTESASPNMASRTPPAPSLGTGLEFNSPSPVGTQSTPLPIMTESFRHQVGKQPYYVNPGLYTEGAAEEITPAHADAYYLKKSELEAYGVNTETHTYCWVRNPQLNAQTHYDHGDRIAQLMRSTPGFEPVLVNGRLIENEELVLAKKPWTPADQKRYEEESLDAAYEYTGKIAEGRGEFKDPIGQTELHRANRMTPQEQRELAVRNSEFNEQNRLIGQTNHLNWWDEMEKEEGYKRALRTEEQFRGVRMDGLTYEQRKTLDALVELKEQRRLEGRSTKVTVNDLPTRRSAPSGGGKIAISAGNSGFPNPTQRRFAGAK